MVRAGHGRQMNERAIEEEHVAVLGLAEMQRAIRNGVEYRLYVGLRTTNDLQDVAGGGLLVQRGGQLAVARLELGEEPTFAIAITA